MNLNLMEEECIEMFAEIIHKKSFIRKISPETEEQKQNIQ
jgi:hypothetical protein